MKKAAGITLFCLLFFFFQPEHLAADNDKLEHFGVSLLFGTAAESIFHYTTHLKDISLIAWGTAIGMLPGLGKEFLDSQEEANYFSGWDLAADFAGALCGAVLGNLFNNLIQVQIKTRRDSFRISILFECTF